MNESVFAISVVEKLDLDGSLTFPCKGTESELNSRYGVLGRNEGLNYFGRVEYSSALRDSIRSCLMVL